MEALVRDGSTPCPQVLQRFPFPVTLQVKERAMRSRKKSTIDIEVQILVVGALILLVTLQGFVIAWGLNKAVDIASQAARPDRGLAFFKVMTLMLTPIVALNA